MPRISKIVNRSLPIAVTIMRFVIVNFKGIIKIYVKNTIFQLLINFLNVPELVDIYSKLYKIFETHFSSIQKNSTKYWLISDLIPKKSEKMEFWFFYHLSKR